MKKVKAKKRQGAAPSEAQGREEIVKADRPDEPAVTPKAKEKGRPAVQAEDSSEGLVSRVTGKVRWWGLTKDFLREVHIELKKVTWPNRKETLAATVMVIGLSVLVAFILGLLDVGLARVVALILRRS